MQYVLVENKQTVLLGPIFWRHRFIQSELDELEVDFQVSPVDPNGYLNINDSLELFPVSGLDIPPYDSTYEQLVGPLWTFNDNTAVGIYNTTTIEISSIKNTLKSLVANERYKKEIRGIKSTVQNIEISVATDREARNVYTQKLVSMKDTDTVQWKFPEIWLMLSKEELSSVLALVNTYVQQQFDWENDIVTQIELANSVEELKTIAIFEKSETVGVV